MDLRGRTITAPWILLDGQFCSSAKIRLDQEGRIAAIIKGKEGLIEANIEEKPSDLIVLDNLALVPGFVNAHSHAFHRCLRGRSHIGTSAADNFWKWRQNMYKLVQAIDFGQLKMICADTFREMLSAGITTVGEFHYVHHADSEAEGDDGDGRYELDLAVAEAAREVGIRLVLIETLYMRAGFNMDRPAPEQWRFVSKSVDEFIVNVARLQKEVAKECYNGLVTVAVAIHSLRAVPLPEARRLFQFAREHGLPLHIHLEEQPSEVADCKTAHEGRTPSQVLLEEVVDDGESDLDFLTAVHCTYSQRLMLDEFAKRRANICICPCTEGYLGDGIPTLDGSDRLCLGTDCNNRIAMIEEMRWMAFCQNMRTNSRNWAGLDAKKLVESATRNGAQSLGLGHVVGDFAVGKCMDFFAVDLKASRLGQFVGGSGEEEEEGDGSQLLDALVFGAGNEEIVLSGVAGQAIINKLIK